VDKDSDRNEPSRPAKVTAKGSALSWLSANIGRLKGPIAAVAAVGAVLGGLAGYWNTYRTVRSSVDLGNATSAMPADAGPLSIVVRPFTNLTGDPSQGYVADGLTASVTADLSRIRDAFVVSTGSALAFKDKALTAQQVGRELGVRFVLEGNVQRNGSKLRINAQLTDAASNAQVWSEAFDGDIGDLFALQDQVTTLIGNSMNRELVVRAARESERRANSATVADLLLRTHALAFNSISLANMQHVEALSRKALALDPDNVQAMLNLAIALGSQVGNIEGQGPEAREKLIAEATGLCARVQAVDPENDRLYQALSAIDHLKGDFDGALRAAERALALSPKNPVHYNNLANELYWQVQPQRALVLLQQGLALDPKHPSDALLGNLCWVEFMLGNYSSSIEWALKYRERNPTYFLGDATPALAYALKGDREAAKAAMEVALKADPTGNTITGSERWIDDPPVPFHPAYRIWLRQTYLPAMRRAGFPE
jgi:TolB-like protein/Tfp pilus assembly protein PilF